MKSSIAELLEQALAAMPELDDAPEFASLSTTVERTRDPRHGDFASNIAMRLAKAAGRNPRELAAAIIERLPASELIAKAEIAGPGFINFHVGPAAFHREVREVLRVGSDYGRQAARETPTVLLEFVSANPTGPLHVGHGRHAAYGATLGNLLKAAGFKVATEYYVNDAGRQMDILGVSVWLRVLEGQGLAIPFPIAGYKGEYINDIAATIDSTTLPSVSAADVLDGLPDDGPDGDKEARIGALIERATELLGEEAFLALRQQSLDSILVDIRDDLSEFGVEFDRWFSERSLTDDGRIDEALEVLKNRQMLYQKDGAWWFRATDFGDEKDRVVVRENGKKTYFASDIAYHFDKRKRGFDHLLDVLGADHHGYIARVRAGLEAMGYGGDDLEVQLVQFVTLYRGGEKMQMSTRSGEFVTLRQLREEVGNDAARFFYVMRSNEQHLDFDMELAKSRSNDNPVYYIQYAHARVASVFRQLAERSLDYAEANGLNNLAALTEPQEKALMSTLSRYPEIIELAASNRAPQHLVHYLRDLANEFHTYYNAHLFIVDDAALRDARLALISATRIVIASGLGILGVNAPDSM
ncbi:arginine--tRNA ligase [Woeseia oceani]|uniref:Arginine--tRNA ligase n=1 Tax=Woeseia oceani TaxID=1548547 RepID=A0A193LBT5_9GAMM|nr:arginine--tRNA ligase [Woeseia oceani]ANO49901.1 arginine--tRNA ligase [Woeseia oceani]